MRTCQSSKPDHSQHESHEFGQPVCRTGAPEFAVARRLPTGVRSPRNQGGGAPALLPVAQAPLATTWRSAGPAVGSSGVIAQIAGRAATASGPAGGVRSTRVVVIPGAGRSIAGRSTVRRAGSRCRRCGGSAGLRSRSGNADPQASTGDGPSARSLRWERAIRRNHASGTAAARANTPLRIMHSGGPRWARSSAAGTSQLLGVGLHHRTTEPLTISVVIGSHSSDSL